MSGPSLPVSQLHSNTQINPGKGINPGLIQGGRPSHTAAPQSLGILETANSGRLNLKLRLGMVNNATQAAQLTARGPRHPAAHGTGRHQTAEQVSESEQEKTDPRVVVMSGHAAHHTNCSCHLHRCDFHVETDAGVSCKYTHTQGRKKPMTGTSLVVQWLRLRSPNAGGIGSIPGQGTRIPHATRWGQKKKKKVYDPRN